MRDAMGRASSRTWSPRTRPDGPSLKAILESGEAPANPM